MNTPVDFQELRKKRQRASKIRKFSILLFIMLGILLTLYLNDLFVRRNITSQLGGMVGSVGGEGFPAAIPSGSVRDIEKIGKNIVVLKDSNLYVYNNKGKQIKNIQRMNERSVVKTIEDRILYYNIGSRNIAVNSGINEIYEKEMDSNIIAADIGRSGEVAVVTNPPDFVAEVNVFSAKGDVFYNRTFPTEMVSLVAVSPKGKQLAVSVIGSKDGLLDFTLQIYPLDSKNSPLVIPVGNRVIVDINFVLEDTVLVLTDKDYLVFDARKGTLVGSYIFLENAELKEFRIHENNMLILTREKHTREYSLHLLNASGAELALKKLIRSPNDFTLDGRYIYIYDGDNVEQYNHAFTLMDSFDVKDINIQRIIAIDDKIYFLTETEISILEKKKGDS